MKKVILISLLLVFSFAAHAQLNIGAPGAIKPSSFKKSDMELFRAATTYFVMRESDKPNQQKIESMLKEVWKFNKIEVIDFDQYKKAAGNTNVLFFGLRSYNYNSQYVANADLFGQYASSSDVYIQLWRNLEAKREAHLEEQVLARIEVRYPYDLEKELKARMSLDAFEYICKGDMKVAEWAPGFLKNYLQVINRCLVENTTRWKFESEVDKEQIKNLKKETLYVDEAVMKKTDSREKESPFKSYPGKYEMIKTEDLANKILESENAFYYLRVYIFGTDKVTTVVNSKTGAFIYSDYKGQAYFFKEKDIKNLAEAMGK